jgi:hypothetical protein
MSRLPFIAGNILKNEAVAAGTLRRGKLWISQFPTLSQASDNGKIDIYQIADDSDKHDPGGALKASVMTFMTELTGAVKVPAFMVLHYRGTDPWNRKFQTDQARRLADHLGFEFLRKSDRGVYISVHHKCEGVPEMLEVGDHRVVARFNEFIYSRPFFSRATLNPEIVGNDEMPRGGIYVPELTADSPGTFRLRNTVVRPLGELPWSTLAVNLEIFGESSAEETRQLLEVALKVYRKRRIRVFYDSKNETIGTIIGGIPIQNHSSQGVSLTLVPKGLTSAEQLKIATSEFAFHLPFLPWHEGKLVLTDAAF